ISIFLLAVLTTMLVNAKDKNFEIKSVDGRIVVNVTAGEKLTYSVTHSGQKIIAPSAIALKLQNGDILGEDVKVKSSDKKEVDSQFEAINYRKAIVRDRYNQLTLEFKNDFGVEFRVYNDAVAYRFITNKKDEIIISNEVANFNFTADHTAYIPYLWDYRGGEIFNASFESPYTVTNISNFAPDSLAILPLLVDVGNNKKAVILEADLEDYPGMYLILNGTKKGLKGKYAPYPLETRMGGYNGMNQIPTKRAGYIAKVDGTRTFPWRAIAISDQDHELLNNDIVQKLASPSRIEDPSWIKPGQVAWDWWNDYNIYHVDFEAGMNNPTFKYYIDFAANNGARYIIIDWGWTEATDLTKETGLINVEELVKYGKERGVGLILWASWYAVKEQMEVVFPKFAEMGVKGWKIDFIDRDDQVAVSSLYEIAAYAAEYKFLVDYHGVYKPTGLQRTYPNVVGFEGVYGLENFKWASPDGPGYAVTIPFIRQMAGPMDYTSGAMTNATRADFCPRNHAPMSMGTRCHQIAQYIIFEVPIQMLSDSPTKYMEEQESTDFITSIPTVFDETLPLDGKIGEYAAIARRKGDTWFVGAMTNWDARDVTIDLSFLSEGEYEAVIFQDGVNAHKTAEDYKKVTKNVTANDTLDIHLSNGGGWAARIERKNP
ncbi:MAG: glycoside hydrolase family 97 protein, partial [Bacteroidota bacterium]